MNDLPKLNELLKPFYTENFICPKTGLKIHFKHDEYVISRNQVVFFKVKESGNFKSELEINSDLVYKIVSDLHTSKKQASENEFKSFLENCWDNEAFENKLKEKELGSKLNFLNEQLEKGIRLLGIASLKKDKQEIKLVRSDLKLLMKELQITEVF